MDLVSTPAPAARLRRTVWSDVVQPKEHGSWSLAFEPVALGLLAAPSPAGAWLGVAVAGGFLARRPLKIACRDASPARRRRARGAFLFCAFIAAAGLLAAVATGGASLLAWLAPAAVAGGVFLCFDLRNGGREEPAEIAGAVAFSCLPAALVAVAGGTAANAGALAAVMLARAVPAVLLVRGRVRGAKTGRLRLMPGLVSSFLATPVAIVLACPHVPPALAVATGAALPGRAALYGCLPLSRLRPRTLGLVELILGCAYVALLGAAWRP
jgi:hypothetical protein